jgi:RHS repeat-associated protein
MPWLGRWLSPDPIGLDGGTNNVFEYVGSNPVNHVDPDGLISSSDSDIRVLILAI